MMLRRLLPMLALPLLAAPAVANESRAACTAAPETAVLARDIAARLPPPDQPVTPGFYVTLTCILLEGGLTAPAIAALSPGALLDVAVDGLTRDRSRADALLAILEAMKQAKPVPAPPPADK